MLIQRIVLVWGLLWVISLSAVAGELEERARVSREVKSLFAAGNFAELERMAYEYRVTQSRTESGLWMLTLFYAGLNEMFNREVRDERYWAALESKTLGWASRYPDSPTPRIAHGIALVSHAWTFRGYGSTDQVRPEDWKPYYAYLRKAYEYLMANKQVAMADPRWYEEMLIVARADNWSYAKFNALVKEAVAKHPYFYQIYFAAIDYLSPSWHGDKEKIEKFANFAVHRTRDQDGVGMYARVYWYASQIQFGNRLFTDSAVVWPKMSKGIDDVLLRYPDQWNINNFAKFSCQAGDLEKTRKLIGQVVAPMPAVWPNIAYFEKCRQWSR